MVSDEDWREIRDPMNGRLVCKADPTGRFLRIRKRYHHDVLIDVQAPGGPAPVLPKDRVRLLRSTLPEDR